MQLSQTTLEAQGEFLSKFGSTYYLKATGPDLPDWHYEFKPSAVEQIPHLLVDEMIVLNRMRNVVFLPGDDWHSKMKFVWVKWNGSTAALIDTIREERQTDLYPVPPTMVLEAGSIVYLVWELDQLVSNDPSVTSDQWQELQRGVSLWMKVPPEIDCPFLPLPYTDHILADGTRKPVSILWQDDESIYSPEDLCRAFEFIVNIDDNIEAARALWLASDAETETETDTINPEYLPDTFHVGALGVWYKPTEGDAPVQVMSTLLWLTGIVQTHTRETHLELSFLSHGDKREKIHMPAAFLADKKALAAFLYQHNVGGFSATVKSLQLVTEYLRASLNNFNEKRATELAHSHFGWTSDGDLVLGASRITKDGITPARLVQVQPSFQKGLNIKGSSEAWSKASAGLNGRWQHCFAVQCALASPLLELMEVGAAVLSLAGDTSSGKTTAANFALSVYGDPRVLSIAAQSTPKAVSEIWRLLSSLPVACNEANTMDTRQQSIFIYNAANGESRSTLTQNVQLRDVNRHACLTMLTSNMHWLSLPDSVLNEATRRRILELTVDSDSALDPDIARDLNEVARANHGHAGLAFMIYVLRHKDEVIQLLNEARTWVTD